MRESYISRRVAGLKPSGIRQFFDIAATMKDVISLGIGEPDFTTPEPILEAGMRSLQRGDTHYTSNAGILELRKALSAHMSGCTASATTRQTEMRDHGRRLGSALPGGDCPARPRRRDDHPHPVLCLLPGRGRAGGRRAGGSALPRWKTISTSNINAIEAAITPRTKAILLGFPSNPTGAVASRERLLEMAELAEKYDLIVISDEIYDRLVYGVPHVCFPTLPGMRKRTMLLGGFSKDYAMTGWRIGYACGPAEMIKGLVRMHQYTVMSAPTIAQCGGPRGAARRRGIRGTDGGGIQPPPQADRDGVEPDRPANL